MFWSIKIKAYRLLVVILIAVFLVACAGAGGVMTNNTESASKLNAAMLTDFPLPKDSRVLNDSSLILGEGEAWVGRLELYSPLSPSDTVAFLWSVIHKLAGLYFLLPNLNTACLFL
jgi:hypothetical protein